MMARTTLDIDNPILNELKRLQKTEGATLGRLTSQLLAEALANRGPERPPKRDLEWLVKPMRAQVLLRDKDALYPRLDENPES